MSYFVKYLQLSITKIIILWLCLSFGSSELNFNNDFDNNKHFKSVPTTIKTFENDTVLLPCHQKTPFRYVRWHRDNVALVDSRHPENPTPERILLWLNGSLQVSNVQTEDTGDYYCEMMTSDSHSVQIHAIEVQYSPTVTTKPSGLFEVPVGATFEIVCETSGVPQPAITWRYNGNILDGNNVGNRQSHLVEIKSRYDSGTVECVATNGVGQPAVAGLYLNVLFMPEVRVIQNVVYTKIGMRAHLECIVEAAPAATMHWFLHGIPVAWESRLTSHYTEVQTNHSVIHYFTETKHILVIKKVLDSDLGLYECRAENKYGAKGMNIELTGRPMPCIFKINPGVQSSTAHFLVWQTESLTPIMEFKLKFKQIPSGNVTPQNNVLKPEWTELTIPSELSVGPIYTTTYTLRGLQPASVFEVAVLARNHFGWSDNSKIIRFATGGEVELPNYSTESEIHYEDTEDDFLNEITQSSLKVFPNGRSGGYSTSIRHTKISLIWINLLIILFESLKC